MKRRRFFSIAATMLVWMGAAAVQGFSKEAEIIYQPYELDVAIHNIEKPCAPVITENYIIFTASPENRSVGIAFDFEDYKIIHPYTKLNHIDVDGNKVPQHLFYCYERQHKEYRNHKIRCSSLYLQGKIWLAASSCGHFYKLGSVDLRA